MTVNSYNQSLLRLQRLLLFFDQTMRVTSMNTEQKNYPERTQHQSIQYLEQEFPNISRMDLDSAIKNSPLLAKLETLLQFAIPVHTFQPQVLALYSQISDVYHQDLLKKITLRQVDDNKRHQRIESKQEQPIEETVKPIRSKMNYIALSRFIQTLSQQDMMSKVSDQVVRQAEIVSKWQVRLQEAAQLPPDYNRRQQGRKGKKHYNTRKDSYLSGKSRKQSRTDQDFQFADKRSQDKVLIVFGKNIDLATSVMRNQLIKRARTSKMIEEQCAILQKADSQITFILNRITEEYFQDFVEELRPYACHECHSIVLAQRLIQKVAQEHSYLTIYSKLVKTLKKTIISIDGTNVAFGAIFVQRLQALFYQCVRSGLWEGRQELHKKHLLGISMFVGKLIRLRCLSKNVFPDCFYQLINSYINQYRANASNKNFYYHESYIQCITKMIQKMGKRYDSLIKKSSDITIQAIVKQLENEDKPEDYWFQYVCDYVSILKGVNEAFPSQRQKIAFLLEDLRCQRALRKQQLQNQESDIVKQILAIDPSVAQQAALIESMAAKCKPEQLMKDFYFQFADGNVKTINKNIQIFKIMSNSAINETAIKTLQENLQSLSTFESDFPYLAEGIAKIMKIVCDELNLQWEELKLSHEDEDAQYFVEKIESKFLKLIVQD